MAIDNDMQVKVTMPFYVKWGIIFCVWISPVIITPAKLDVIINRLLKFIKVKVV